MILPSLVLLAALSTALPAGSKVEARFLNFSAQDRHGIFLRDLKREEVSLWVDGQPVEASYLGYKNVSTAYCFLIENSPRTSQFKVSLPQYGQVNVLDRIRFSLADDFFMSIVETGKVMLAEYGLDRDILQDFTPHDDLLGYALYKMKPKPSVTDRRNVPVGRHMAWAVDILRDRSEKRKILVMFTTTIDRESYQDMEEYKDMLQLSDVELYVVSFSAGRNSGTDLPYEVRMNRYFFKQLTNATSGKLYLSGEHVFMDEFMNDLMTRLSNSYTLGFYVKPGKKRGEHRIKIRVRDKKVRVTHRKKIVF